MAATIEQVISFWQSKLDYDDANLISSTVMILMQDTIKYLEELKILMESKNEIL